jgi:hypothetical protein
MSQIPDIPIELIAHEWSAGLDNTQIDEALLFDVSWVGGSLTARGKSLYMGMVQLELWALPWNLCSATGGPPGGGQTIVRRRHVY